MDEAKKDLVYIVEVVIPYEGPIERFVHRTPEGAKKRIDGLLEQQSRYRYPLDYTFPISELEVED
jgi:hypothetical protein